MKWKNKKFSELTVRELHEIYKVRVDIFVVEQQCPYHEVDDLDLKSYHSFIEDELGHIMAYARVIPEKEAVRIGRVLVTENYRKSGIGKQLMEKVMAMIQCRYPERDAVLQAQSYVESFYERFGFVKVSEEYLEDGIPHVDMIRKAEVSSI